MTQQATKYGIYVSPKEKKAVRITSPYWIPESPDWVYLTDEVNATLLRIRQLAKEKRLTPEADAITWGAFPTKG